MVYIDRQMATINILYYILAKNYFLLCYIGMESKTN